MGLWKTTSRRVGVLAQRPSRIEPGGLLLEGALDEVPVDAARRATDVALALLDHADSHHASQKPSLRVARRGPLLNLWLTEPTCSTRCLERSPHLCRLTDDIERTDERLFLNESAGGGLRVHWVLALPTTGPRHLEQRPGGMTSTTSRPN